MELATENQRSSLFNRGRFPPVYHPHFRPLTKTRSTDRPQKYQRLTQKRERRSEKKEVIASQSDLRFPGNPSDKRFLKNASLLTGNIYRYGRQPFGVIVGKAKKRPFSFWAEKMFRDFARISFHYTSLPMHFRDDPSSAARGQTLPLLPFPTHKLPFTCMQKRADGG